MRYSASRAINNFSSESPRRRCLLGAGVGVAEEVTSGAVPHGTATEGFSPQFQVAFPYRGAFVWHVGRDDVFGDANQVLFVRGGEDYRVSEPVPGGYAEIVVTPERSVLAEIAKVAEDRLGAHYLFRNRSRPAHPPLQNLRACFSHWATGAAIQDALAGEVMVLSLVRSAFEDSPPQVQPTASTRRLMRRVKEFLGAELANPIRLRDVGRAAGASPTYLTNIFRRVEGVSLHRYLTQLRLARALAVLPQADDLTVLALGIGFSSHSHFSAAFRRAFGCTPSQFRQTARGH